MPPPPPPPRTPTPVDSEPEPDCEPGGPDDSDIADVTVIHDYCVNCKGKSRFLADALANKCELKKIDYMKVVKKPAEVAQEQLEEKSKFVLPGVCISKTRVKLATKAGEREMCGKVVTVKAKPAKTVVKAFPVSSLKKSIAQKREEAAIAARVQGLGLDLVKFVPPGGCMCMSPGTPPGPPPGAPPGPLPRTPPGPPPGSRLVRVANNCSPFDF